MVSSFYGGRKSSVDALNREYQAQPTGPSRGRDDASSFFQPERSSADHLNGRSSSGYNRGTFYPGGREEPLKGGRDEEKDLGGETEAWDVYADFNNAGPRYSTAFGVGQTQAGYTALPPTPSVAKEGLTEGASKVEMVTVPALGAEWGKEEMRQMTKAAKRERKQESRSEFWKSWNRGERGLCGHYFTRRTLVFFLFGLCCVIGIVLAFTIPRVPSFAFNGRTPLVNATGSWGSAVPTGFSRAPTNFSFPAYASLQVNTQANYLPLRFTHMHATVYDLETSRQVGSGDYSGITLPAKSFPEIRLPLNFTYFTSNTSDQTWQNWYNACNNKINHPENKRPPVKFLLVLDMNILGLPSKHSTSAQVSDADCPIELPVNAS